MPTTHMTGNSIKFQKQNDEEAKDTSRLQHDIAIPDEILQRVMGFIGLGHYRFVAGVSHRWKRIYENTTKKADADCRCTRNTCIKSIVESVSRCCLYLQEQDKNEALEQAKRKPEKILGREVRFRANSTTVGVLCTHAAYHGNLEVLKHYLFLPQGQEGKEAWDRRRLVCAAAAAGGRLETLQWCREIGCNWDMATCIVAAMNGHVDVLQWCRDNGCYFYASEVCLRAAKTGHWKVLQWFQESNNCREISNMRVCHIAAQNGHLELLQWGRENGFEWDWKICTLAAERGHLEILQWARENGCDWSPVETCAAAARGGHLEVLQWARGNGAEWDAQVCVDANRNKHWHVLQWALDNGCPWDQQMFDSAEAGFERHSYLAVWARRNGLE